MFFFFSDVVRQLVDGSNAEVGQLIKGIKFGCFLTPDMASKKDARHGIDLFTARITRCHVWHRFLTPCLASKSIQTLYPQSLAQLRHLSLHLCFSFSEIVRHLVVFIIMLAEICKCVTAWDIIPPRVVFVFHKSYTVFLSLTVRFSWSMHEVPTLVLSRIYEVIIG